MSENFLEVVLCAPPEGKSFTDLATISALQWTLDQLAPEPGIISPKFRRSTTNPSHILFVLGFNSIADHDALDIKGFTPRVLKTLIANAVPLSSYLMFYDLLAVDFGVPAFGVEAFYVKDGAKGAFDGAVERNGMAGAWVRRKHVPPKPTVMPTDPVELAIIEGQVKQAEEDAKKRTPLIWVSLFTPETAGARKGFRDAVEGLCVKVESGEYENFLTAGAAV